MKELFFKFASRKLAAYAVGMLLSHGVAIAVAGPLGPILELGAYSLMTTVYMWVVHKENIAKIKAATPAPVSTITVLPDEPMTPVAPR